MKNPKDMTREEKLKEKLEILKDKTRPDKKEQLGLLQAMFEFGMITSKEYDDLVKKINNPL